MRTRPFLVGWIVVCLAAAWAAAQTGEPPRPRSGGAVQDAITKQQLVMKRYAVLTQIMAEVSRKLEATDPQTAATISAAAQRAEAARIAKDMHEVVRMLEAGMVIPADVTQGRVILRLREVLNALRGEDGLEWRLFMIQELQQQLADLSVLIERQQVLERQSRMLAFGDQMRGEIAEAQRKVAAAAKHQEGVLLQTRRMTASPAARELSGVRDGLAGLLRRLDTPKDELWNPTPAPDQLARNIVTVRRYHAQTVALRADFRGLLSRDVVAKAVAALPPPQQGESVVEAFGKAAEELQRSSKGMAANDLKEGLVALSEAKALLRDTLDRLDETLLAFPEARPAAAIAAEQKQLDDAVTGLEPAMRKLFPAGLAAIDDTPEGTHRVASASDRLTARPTEWAGQAPVLLALDPAGAATRQEQSLDKLRDWATRLDEASTEIDRIKEDPQYPVQAKEQEGIGADLRSILDGNRQKAETIENDAELSSLFTLLRVAMENSCDHSAKAVAELTNQHPREANVEQNEVIHLLTTVRDRVGPELKMDKNKYAMNEQMLGRVQRMIVKQKVFCAQGQAVWEKRAGDGTFGRTEQLRIDALAKDQAGMEEDFKVGWEIVNTAHNVGYALFPPEARVLWELARGESKAAAVRLQGGDPGPDTQRVQESVLERLKAIATLLGPGFTDAPQELDRKFTYDSFLSRMSLHNTRANEIGLLVTLQQDVHRRLERVEAARQGGKVDAAQQQEFEQLRQLQEHIRQGLRTWALHDAKKFMAPDYMPTQYGRNTGGSVQGPAAPSIKGMGD